MTAKDSHKGALYHERLANSFQLSVAVLVPVMAIICGFLARQSIFDHNFYLGDEIYFILSAAYILTSAVYFYFRRHNALTQTVSLFCLLSFNIVTLLYTLLLTGFVNVFLVAWIPLMVSTDLYFGRIGLFFSFMALVTSGIFTAIMYPNLSDPLYLIVLTQEVLGIGVVAVVISSIRRIAETEGQALVRVSEQEELQRERLLSLINSMGDAVVSTDDEGRVTVYNASFLSLLDTNEDLEEKLIDDILQLHDRNNQPISIFEEARKVRKVFSRTDLSHTFSDNEKARLYVNVAPIRPGYQSRNERGFILVLRDITKEKTLEDEQDEFISVVSHELRTPIAIAEGNLSNIQVLRKQGASEAAIDRVIEDAHDHVMYLAKIINDLGTLSRAEQGIYGEMEDVAIKDIILELSEKYDPLARQKGLHFELDLAPHLPTLHTSRQYVQEIIENFLTNAIKYTTEGAITMSAHIVDEILTVSVKDTGVGIGKSDQPHIFEKFYRSEDYRTRESGGTGLGLYISSRLARELGYTISFSSQLDHGSTFSLAFTDKTSTHHDK